ncbi:MAG: 2,3-diketo-L-gulonate-binding periplasmic protein YiaO precursor [Synergistetes bacterium ADurb.Bin155]|nr:TRAP transporter substrate-binding protein [Synergistales bacterium]MBP8996484.1 TRAP transporter substrate-binding protein [Synergistales bacterium]NMD17322.1 TRAP transporter substrate-binding protein [Synergistaceae bacterium]OQB45475.1 MAG: 2,3-diketo-L-gulonate-binding periplasmic protein YiaO precursor [Synergistetes bacterium ADurb.Bin155]
MRKLLAVFTVMAVVAVMAGAAFAAPEYTIKVAYIGSDSHPTMRAMKEYFVKPIEEGSQGRIKVELYPNAQLGGDREISEGVQMGTIQMAIPASAPLAGFDKRVQVLELPYLFTTKQAAFEAADGILGEKLNSYLAAKGMLILGFQENGFRHVTNNRGPVKTPADLKGIKIRTMENPIHLAFFKAVGANPTPMSWGELYTALQQGTVDAQENPYAMIVDGKFYEVQKYVSETGHVFSFEVLIANKKFMDNLPADLNALVVKSAREATLKQREYMDEEEAAFKDEVLKAGMIANSLTPEEKQPFVDAAEKVYPMFEKDFGEEVMEILKQVRK